ncbi:SGNH/GDSL hydrolase family protein [Aquisphaera insulae]|uniref:SGNH/GDSL hydrolase family protein n=1 Tax=Aquisphaera insulae TaxID=2712864 RepID=UPI0013EB4D7C|nr:SGNH/GDSL hydrolase family protein [Aquisphaera insulae]
MSRTRQFLTLVGCALLGMIGSTALAEDPPYPLVTATECRPRDGLPNFLAKARTPGAGVKVAYLGGSITAQDGWRPKTLAYFNRTYKDARFSEINAAIGGTGSDLGVYRLGQDVLDRGPDLMFVEFATNDGGAPPDQIRKCMEGIVRQTWRALPGCDICFVYTLTESAAGPMLEGKFPRSASAMEAVADHYGIPTIHMAMEVAKLAKEGRLVWAGPLPGASGRVVFANDGVHPYPETGHELYLQAIVRSLGPIAVASRAARPHALGPPLSPGNYEKATLIPIEEAVLSPGFTPVDLKADAEYRHFRGRLRSLYRGTHPGDSITFKFKGTSASIYDIIGPSAGQVIVTVDGRPSQVVRRFDAFCLYDRLATVPIAADLTDTIHEVKVEIDSHEPDRIKILGEEARKIQRPERFRGTNFYPGAILVVGELVR